MTSKQNVSEHNNTVSALAKMLKRDYGKHIRFSIVDAWYAEHYLMAGAAHRYIKSVAEILLDYISRNNLCPLPTFISTMDSNNWLSVKFSDLEPDVNEQYYYRVVATCCGILLGSSVSKLPGYIREADGTV